MVYAAELDSSRQEVRRGYASNTLVLWPKRPGVGNVSVTGTPAYEILSASDGVTIATGSMTVTDVDSVDKLTVTVDASNTTTYALLEDYSLVVSYVYSSITYVETVRFDCVLEPYTPALALNDLADEVADIEERLTAQGARLATTARTAVQMASTYGVSAWAHVRLRIKAKLYEQGTTRPYMIVDREPIELVVRAKALELIYRAEGGGLESESRALAEDWRLEADMRWAGMGPISFSTDDDRTPDTTINSFGTVQAVRSW